MPNSTISLGSYLFIYSRALNLGLFQRMGPFSDAGANNVYVGIRNFTSGFMTQFILGDMTSCTTQAWTFDWFTDMTNNLALLPPSSNFVGTQQIGPWLCDGWNFKWAAGFGGFATTWVRQNVLGQSVPVRTDFLSAPGGHAYHSSYNGDALIELSQYQIWKQYMPCPLVGGTEFKDLFSLPH